MLDATACGRLASRLDYVDGQLIWKQTKQTQLIGKPAGTPDKDGYLHIHAEGGLIYAHRLIYFMHHGYLPELIDHIDGDVSNNRIENLRAANRLINSINCKTPRTNTSGHKGVYKHKDGKWQVGIRVDGKLKHIGLFSDFDAACKARVAAEQKYHGAHARKGKQG